MKDLVFKVGPFMLNLAPLLNEEFESAMSNAPNSYSLGGFKGCQFNDLACDGLLQIQVGTASKEWPNL